MHLGYKHGAPKGACTPPRFSASLHSKVLLRSCQRSKSSLSPYRVSLYANLTTCYNEFATYMNRQQLLDLYFLEARSKLIDLAAFLDRLDRATGVADFRLEALKKAFEELNRSTPDRAEHVLLSLSDSSKDPIPAATTKAACGAWSEHN